MTKRVLIITYEMTPYCKSWGGCQRIYYLGNQLVEQGFETFVLSTKGRVKEAISREVKFKQIFLNTFFDNKTPVGVTKQGEAKSRFIFKYLLKKLFGKLVYGIEKFLFNEPSPKVGMVGLIWMLRANKKVVNVILQEKIETVIISAPPFILLNFSRYINRLRNKPKIILDYRDPWNLWNGGSFFSNYLERNVLIVSDIIVVTTDNLKTDLCKKFKIDPKRIKVVFNGFSAKEWEKVKDQRNISDSKIKISYIGDISFKKGSYRDASEFFKAYELIRSQNIFKIKFVGVDFNNELVQLKNKYPEVVFIPKVSQIESYKYMLEADVLLNLHTSNDNSGRYLIGGKIFDYIRSDKIIFSINSKHSFEQSFLKSIQYNVVCSENDSNKILNALYHIKQTAAELPKKHDREFVLENYSRENQNRLFINLI